LEKALDPELLPDNVIHNLAHVPLGARCRAVPIRRRNRDKPPLELRPS
jgi:hypothetical protein